MRALFVLCLLLGQAAFAGTEISPGNRPDVLTGKVLTATDSWMTGGRVEFIDKRANLYVTVGCSSGYMYLYLYARETGSYVDQSYQYMSNGQCELLRSSLLHDPNSVTFTLGTRDPENTDWYKMDSATTPALNSK